MYCIVTASVYNNYYNNLLYTLLVTYHFSTVTLPGYTYYHLLILVTMLTLSIIILISSFTTGITANSYCDQLKQLKLTTKNIKKNCFIKGTCCEVNALHSFTKPSAVYQLQHLCGGKWGSSVFCDTQTADGGWTVIQRRKDGSVDFNRPWSDYEKGFGDLNGEFWYGLENMNCLTQTGQWELRIDFEFEDKTRSHLHYNVFKVGSATDEYPLTISGFNGIIFPDPFATGRQNGQKFSTYDNDNDGISGNSALQFGSAKGNGGWWYNGYWYINLNYNYNPRVFGTVYIGGYAHNPRWIEMKIRPLNCDP